MKPAVCSTLLLSSVAASTALGGTPVLDGALDPSAGYTLLSSVAPLDRSNPFTSPETYDASAIYTTHDATHVHFFVRCRLGADFLPGILLLINSTAQTGAAAGTALGAVPSGDHVFSPGSAAPDWKADFEVDRAYVLWNSTVVSGAKYVGTPYGYFVGNVETTSPGGDAETQFAFNNAGQIGTGWELSIRRSALGDATSSDTIQAFAVLVGYDGTFTRDSTPTTLLSDPGQNPDFTAISGDQFTSPVQLPATLSSLSVE